MECDYCDESFETEEAYLEHLRDTHRDELGAIDRRRVASLDDGADSELPTGPLVLGGVVLVGVVLVVWGIFIAGGSGGGSSDAGRTPTGVGTVHYHGTIVMTVDGERVDFSQDEYQLQAQAFHFERGERRRWHGHARGVTLAWAMESLGIDVTPDSVTFEGTTYAESEGDTVRVTVNGEPVTPSAYVLQEDDSIRIVVESG